MKVDKKITENYVFWNPLSEPSQTTDAYSERFIMERLTISRRSSILDVWPGYGYSSGFRRLRPIFWHKLFESRECELELTELFIRMTKFQWTWRFHCAESVQILSYFWSLFSYIWAEYGDYSVNLRIQSKHRKMRNKKPEITLYLEAGALWFK